MIGWGGFTTLCWLLSAVHVLKPCLLVSIDLFWISGNLKVNSHKVLLFLQGSQQLCENVHNESAVGFTAFTHLIQSVQGHCTLWTRGRARLAIDTAGRIKTSNRLLYFYTYKPRLGVIFVNGAMPHRACAVFTACWSDGAKEDFDTWHVCSD